MGENYMNKNRIVYINMGYILSQIGHTRKIDNNNVTMLKDKVNKLIPDSNIELLVFDMDNIRSTYAGVERKSSYLRLVFKDVEEQTSLKFILFANCPEDTASFLREKDFPESNKICVLSFEYETDFLRSCKEATNNGARETIREIVWGKRANSEAKDIYLGFVSSLISGRIKTVLSENNCIEDIENKKKHILSSTPVHVNKYVNLKPILEKNVYFQEVCYLLYRQIVNKCSTPDYIVASSRNSIYIASGLMKYFKTTNMIIIDQVSPVTKLSNFSNLEDIKSKRTYAIIEDFCCMGTEIKTVKSVLWSRGVDAEQDCYVFPIVSTNLYGEETNEKFKAQRIYPLYILEKSVNYLMFTHNCCPVCNELNCQHSKTFNLK